MSSNFIYYFPTTSMEDAAKAFEKYGCQYACPPYIAKEFGCAVTLNGPDGKPGVIYQRKPTVETLKYEPEKQTWKRVPNTPAFVGVWNDAPPTAESLLRTDAISGKYVELAGDKWLIPVARFECDNATTGNLTPMVDVDEFGNIIQGDFSPTQAKLNQMAERLALSFIAGFDKLVNDNSPFARFEFQIDDTDPFVILAANYRVTPAEIVLLKLFRWRDDAFKDIVKIFIDSDAYLLLQAQKKTSELTSMSVGDKDDSPTTDQQ